MRSAWISFRDAQCARTFKAGNARRRARRAWRKRLERMIVNEYRPEVSREIGSLQTRANQLQTTSAACQLRLASLAVESEAARSANDGIALQKVGRKIHLEEQRAAHVAGEIRTLLELIAARRSRYGPQPLPRLLERP